MRTRLLFTLSLTALSAVALAGCTGGPAPARVEPAPTVDLCAVAAPAGTASDAIEVDGAVGSPASARVPAPMTITGTERSVVVEGTGDELESSSLVDYAVTVFDAASGGLVRTEGYDDAPRLPVAASSLGQYLGCATVGSRVVVTVPATELDPASVWVVDVLGSSPSHATGAPQDAVEGMPKVELADSGAPTITVPTADPPADTRVAVLKKGDGEVVGAGDTVLVQYAGVRWSDGTVIDSSWGLGTPAVVVTTDVVPGYREALEGQSVGSQVIVVIPPDAAYGDGVINEENLVGETLVFVVDILDTIPAA